MEYISLINSYSSIFELSVALNITYAASKQFRDSLKHGFLKNIQNMDRKYSLAKDKIESDLNTISERHISSETKEKFKLKFTNKLEKLQENSLELKHELDDAQEDIANKIKPIYVYVAIFSLYMLFLGGQESINSTFPIDGVNSLIFVSVIVLPAFYLLGFFSNMLTIGYSTTAVSFAILSGLFFPVLYEIPLTEKHFVDSALVIAFLPFIFSMSRLVLVTLKLEASHRWSYWMSLYEIKKIKSNYEQIKESTDYFDNFK